MSYCRWSSDDFQCDVYVYENVSGGWTTHVASNRPVIDRSVLPPIVTEDPLSWYRRLEAVSEQLKTAERKPIGLPHDGKTFNDETPGEAADTLEMLRAVGYNVPQYAIDALREEQNGLEGPEK